VLHTPTREADDLRTHLKAQINQAIGRSDGPPWGLMCSVLPFSGVPAVCFVFFLRLHMRLDFCKQFGAVRLKAEKRPMSMSNDMNDQSDWDNQ
jgi:hypothetical protein